MLLEEDLASFITGKSCSHTCIEPDIHKTCAASEYNFMNLTSEKIFSIKPYLFLYLYFNKSSLCKFKSSSWYLPGTYLKSTEKRLQRAEMQYKMFLNLETSTQTGEEDFVEFAFIPREIDVRFTHLR